MANAAGLRPPAITLCWHGATPPHVHTLLPACFIAFKAIMLSVLADVQFLREHGAANPWFLERKHAQYLADSALQSLG